jgi:hypothetical protein
MTRATVHRADFVDAQRWGAWAEGRALVGELTARYCEKYDLEISPPPAKIVDELLTEILGCQLERAPLRKYVYAETDWIAGKTIVTFNSETSKIPGVKDAEGVSNVAKLHELIHVMKDEPTDSPNQGVLAGFDAPPRLVCRRGEPTDRSAVVSAREFRAEEGGRAAAISMAYLKRSQSFTRLLKGAGRMANGAAWALLYDLAPELGVNISALVTQLTLEGLIVIEKSGGKQVLHVQPSLIKAAGFET